MIINTKNKLMVNPVAVYPLGMGILSKKLCATTRVRRLSPYGEIPVGQESGFCLENCIKVLMRRLVGQELASNVAWVVNNFQYYHRNRGDELLISKELMGNAGIIFQNKGDDLDSALKGVGDRKGVLISYIHKVDRCRGHVDAVFTEGVVVENRFSYYPGEGMNYSSGLSIERLVENVRCRADENFEVHRIYYFSVTSN